VGTSEIFRSESVLSSMAIRKTMVLAWLPPKGQQSAIASPKYIDFGILLPKGVRPLIWNPDPNNLLPLPRACDADHGWGDFQPDFHLHPNLYWRESWDPKKWQEPDERAFFGWRLENSDENLARLLCATFEWTEIGGPDVVMGTVLPVKNQVTGIGIEPPNPSASIQWRPVNGQYGDPVAAKTWKLDVSKWQMQITDLNASPVIGRITAANHIEAPATPTTSSWPIPVTE
jgi:hypothetical protein